MAGLGLRLSSFGGRDACTDIVLGSVSALVQRFIFVFLGSGHNHGSEVGRLALRILLHPKIPRSQFWMLNPKFGEHHFYLCPMLNAVVNRLQH